MKEELKVGDLIRILKKRWITVLLTTLIVTGSALCVTQFIMPPIYSTTTQVILVPQASGNADSKSLLQSYIDMINGDIVLENVKKNLGLKQSVEELRQQITATNNENSQIIHIKAESHNPESARQLALQVSKISLEKMQQYLKVTDLQIINDNGIEGSTKLLFPKPLFISIIAAATGLLGGIGLALLKEQWREYKRRARGVSRSA